MKKYIAVLCCLLSVLSIQAQDESRQKDVETLFEWFKKASGFDRNYPREKVYLHMDNTSYMANDTLWYKAYVVRASSLLPTDVSRVLYVDLLNADGQEMERQMLHIDSLGQADGAFVLKQPIRAGYYEVRAYTRAMTNWEGYFSRIVPIFESHNPQKAEHTLASGDASQLTLPSPRRHDKVTLGAPRPYIMGNKSERVLTFYPEGGARAKGIAQRIAYELTDGRGTPADDTLQLYNKQRQLLATFAPLYAGRGYFILLDNLNGGYVSIKGEKKQFTLPTATTNYGLRAQQAEDGLSLIILANDSVCQQSNLLGVAVLSREKVCYFDTLTVNENETELFIPRKALRGGVNRVELYDVSGHSQATRLVWVAPNQEENRCLNVHLEQNEKIYAPFSPAIVTIDLHDKANRPVSTTLSVAVRDGGSNITDTRDGGLEANLLLTSELRGYVARPDLYFEKDDAAHRQMLDLLLMVQGWQANQFSVMCGAEPFTLQQPIEEHPILRGRLFADNARQKPRANYQLNMLAYSLDGQTMQGKTRTDKDGRFAFENNAPFKGNFYAQFSQSSDTGKKSWSRLSIDQWFAPQPRAFTTQSLALNIPLVQDSLVTYQRLEEPETFAWRDTIPRTLPSKLNEAKVTIRGKYHGLTGTRYTWLGGENKGLDCSTVYYNVAQIMQRLKDEGKPLPDLGELLPMLDNHFSVQLYGLYRKNGSFEEDEADNEKNGDEKPEFTTGGDHFGGLNSEAQPTARQRNDIHLEVDKKKAQKVMMKKMYEAPHVNYNANYVTMFINNLPWYENYYLRYQDNVFIQSAEGYKSITFVPSIVNENAVTGKDKRLGHSDKDLLYVYEQPDLYRQHCTRGQDQRILQGFASRPQFYSPDYRRFDLPSDNDVRRTLYWNPAVKTDKDGKAHVLFFTNSRPEQWLDISVRGVSQDGGVVESN